MKFRVIAALMLAALWVVSGCAVVAVGGAAAVGASGTYMWINGELKTDYYAPFDKTWTAVEKAIAAMRGTEVAPNKEIAQGTITTVIEDEKVQFYVSYKEKNVTNVAIRVGVVGNRLSSQRLHDKIAENLKK